MPLRFIIAPVFGRPLPAVLVVPRIRFTLREAFRTGPAENLHMLPPQDVMGEAAHV